MTDLCTVLDSRRALLVVDMQREYCTPKGIIGQLGHATAHFTAVGERFHAFAQTWRPAFDLVIFVRTELSPWPRSLAMQWQYGRNALNRVPDPTLTDWFGLSPMPGDHVITKRRYSAFRDTELDAMLRANRIQTLVVGGATTDVCVDTTVRDAFMRDYSVVVLADCCGGSSLARHQHALDILDGFFGRVHTSNEVAAALSELAPTAPNNLPPQP